MPLIPITVGESASKLCGPLNKNRCPLIAVQIPDNAHLVCLNNTVVLSLTIFFTSISPGFGTNVMFSHQPSLKGKLLKPLTTQNYLKLLKPVFKGKHLAKCLSPYQLLMLEVGSWQGLRLSLEPKADIGLFNDLSFSA